MCANFQTNWKILNMHRVSVPDKDCCNSICSRSQGKEVLGSPHDDHFDRNWDKMAGCLKKFQRMFTECSKNVP